MIEQLSDGLGESALRCARRPSDAAALAVYCGSMALPLEMPNADGTTTGALDVQPIELPSEATAPPGRAMKGHRWQYSEQNGYAVSRSTVFARVPCSPSPHLTSPSISFGSPLPPPGGCRCGGADLCPRQPWPAHEQKLRCELFSPSMRMIRVFCSPRLLKPGLQCEQIKSVNLTTRGAFMSSAPHLSAYQMHHHLEYRYRPRPPYGEPAPAITEADKRDELGLADSGLGEDIEGG
jgi:hypothetical protein